VGGLEEHVYQIVVPKQIVLATQSELGVGEEGEGLFGRLLEYAVGGGDIAYFEVVLRGEWGEVSLVEALPPLKSLLVAGCGEIYTRSNCSSSESQLFFCWYWRFIALTS
jgi:hypothetical protein